jgi:magnesium transporter
VTVCRNSDAVWDLLSRRILAKDFGFENRKSMVIRIFRKVVVLYLRFLKEINHRINLVEDLFHETMKNEDIIKLLNIEKSLVYFSASLKSNEIVLEKLLRIKIFQLDEEDKDEVEDIIIDNKQALEMSNIYGSILRDMMDAFSSVISNELNIVMKTLTALTIILMIPTLVSSFYGMNVRLPFQEHPHAFLITLLISVFLTVIGIIIFVKRKLF